MSLFTKEMLIHVGIELIIITGISFYFHKQNINLSSKINELENKIDNYEEKNLKYQKQINQLNKKINDVLTQQQQTNQPKPSYVSVSEKKLVSNPVVTKPVLPEIKSHYSLNEIIDNESDDESSVEEILDLELEDELKDLF